MTNSREHGVGGVVFVAQTLRRRIGTGIGLAMQTRGQRLIRLVGKQIRLAGIDGAQQVTGIVTAQEDCPGAVLSRRTGTRIVGLCNPRGCLGVQTRFLRNRALMRSMALTDSTTIMMMAAVSAYRKLRTFSHR